MRNELLREKVQGVRVVHGTAEKMGVENGWADAVVCAQVGLVIVDQRHN